MNDKNEEGSKKKKRKQTNQEKFLKNLQSFIIIFSMASMINILFIVTCRTSTSDMCPADGDGLFGLSLRMTSALYMPFALAWSHYKDIKKRQIKKEKNEQRKENLKEK